MMSIPFEFGFNTEDHITRSLFLYCVKCRRQTILQSANTSDVRDSNVAFFSQKIVLCPKNKFAWSVKTEQEHKVWFQQKYDSYEMGCGSRIFIDLLL